MSINFDSYEIKRIFHDNLKTIKFSNELFVQGDVTVHELSVDECESSVNSLQKEMYTEQGIIGIAVKA